MTEQPVKVTLVHGTFASRAKWVRRGPMTKALDSAGIAHQPFVWSGGNSHRARIRAAEDLARHLREDQKEGVRQAVVAHSHGGNIAVHAVWRLMKLRDGSIPVVTLATPFLFANRRAFHKLVLIAAGMWALVAFVVMTGFAVVVAIEGYRGDVPSWWVILFAAGAWVTIAVQLFCSGYWSLRHGRPWQRDAQDRLIGLIQVPDTTGDALLVIRAADDEASTSLALAQLTGWIAATAARLSRPQAWMRLYGVLATAGVILSLLSSPDLEEFVFIALLIGINVACLLSMALVSAPALLNLSHGLDGPTTTLFAFVSAEATPPGRHAVLQRPLKDPKKEGLSHSSLYDDKDVIRWVVEHVREQR